jgi:benzodiazapine receptor
MDKGTWWALAICFGVVALEGLFAGPGVRQRLAQLKQPHYSPPFAVWMAIGGVYYLICFVVLSRLINSTESPLHGAALAAMLLLLIGNAVWNLTFFRLKNVEASTIVMVACVAAALVVEILLTRIDPVARWVFLLYLLYLVYAAWWSVSIRKLNRETPVDL